MKEDEEEEEHSNGSLNEEENNDSPNFIQEQPPVSLFKTTQRRPWPWQRNYANSIHIFLSYI